jgi:glutathione S-transferase
MGCSSSQTAKKVEIFGLPVSMNALSSIVMVQELKIGELVKTMPGEQTNTKEFLEMNPFHAIPTLREGKLCLAESSTLLRYLASSNRCGWYPVTDAARCAFINWAMDRSSGPMGSGAGQTIYPILGFATAPANKEEVGKTVSNDIKEFADWFLKEKFIGGAKPSIADFKVAPVFFAFSHPRVKKEAFVEVPDRILQFNKDFLAAVPSATFADLKGLIEGDTGAAEIPGPSSEVKVELKNLIAEKKCAGKGNVEIYGAPPSANSLGAILLARHTKVGELKFTMPGEGTSTAEFLAMNPFHAIPTLKDGDFTLAESSAILRYIGHAYAPEYYQHFAVETRGFIDWAMDRFGSSVSGDFAKTVYPALGFAEVPEEEEKKARATAAVENLKSFCDHFLKGKFIAGDKLSIADFKIAPFFFAWAHPYIKANFFVEVPERVAKFNSDFAAAVADASFFEKADGNSLKEMLDAK